MPQDTAAISRSRATRCDPLADHICAPSNDIQAAVYDSIGPATGAPRTLKPSAPSRSGAAALRRRLARQLSKLTGESLTTAVTKAVRERLDRVRREQGTDLAERLLAIGRDCAAHLTVPFRTIDHDKMLYDDRGLPK